MNTIAFAGVPEYSGERAGKNFEIIVPLEKCTLCFAECFAEFNRGEIAVIPPYLTYTLHGKGLHVVIEQALLPFKEVRILRDDSACGIEHAARQAAKYSSSGQKNGGVAAALGTLLVAYVTDFAGSDKLSPVVATLRDEIRKNVSDYTFSLEDSIKKLPLNYDYVRKLFKRELGVTPHDYLIDCRMKLARELMESGIGNRYSNYSISQIAEACGFAEPLYFSRVFKKFYGVSPSYFIKSKK